MFASSSAELQVLTSRQASLRAQIERLRQQDAEAAGEFEQDIQLRITRTDIAWQSWVGRQKAAINAELARVSVEKERRLKDVKQAFGKKAVSAELLMLKQGVKRPDEPGR